MPIRINLLAEAQAAEEIRRKDPVKRAIYVAICIVVGVLVWSSSLQVKIVVGNVQLSNQQARLNTRTNAYNQILLSQARLADVQDKLDALSNLSVNRLLFATMLDSLMHATVDGIQVTRLRTEHGFDIASAPQPAVKGAKSTSTEHFKLVLDAKDSSANPGDAQINKFKETLAQTPYFLAQQISTNNILLKNLSTPQLDNDSGKPYVLFTLECTYPDKSR